MDSISSWRANWTQIEHPIPPNSGFVLQLILDLPSIHFPLISKIFFVQLEEKQYLWVRICFVILIWICGEQIGQRRSMDVALIPAEWRADDDHHDHLDHQDHHDHLDHLDHLDHNDQDDISHSHHDHQDHDQFLT